MLGVLIRLRGARLSHSVPNTTLKFQAAYALCYFMVLVSTTCLIGKRGRFAVDNCHLVDSGRVADITSLCISVLAVLYYLVELCLASNLPASIEHRVVFEPGYGSMAIIEGNNARKRDFLTGGSGP